MEKINHSKVVFGLNLFKIRAKLKFTTSEMEIITGISRGTINKVEKNRQKAGSKYETFEKLSAPFGFTVEKMMTIDIDDYAIEQLKASVRHYLKTHGFSEAHKATIKEALNKEDGLTEEIKKLIISGKIPEAVTTAEMLALIDPEQKNRFGSIGVSDRLQKSPFFSSKKTGNKTSYILNAKGRSLLHKKKPKS